MNAPLRSLAEAHSERAEDGAEPGGARKRRSEMRSLRAEESEELNDDEGDEDASGDGEVGEENVRGAVGGSRQGGRGGAGPAAAAPHPRYDYASAAALRSRESFLTAYQKFYGNGGRELPAMDSRFEPFDVFMAVAREGGYEAVTATGGWKRMAVALRPSMASVPKCGQVCVDKHSLSLQPSL